MSKKILFLIFAAFVAIVPIQKASAAQYFIGVTIASASAPGYTSVSGDPIPTDHYWCLPTGPGSDYTDFYIRDSSGNNLTAVSPTSNPVSLPSQTCAGDTVWSALFNLTSGTAYQIYFDLPDSEKNFCPGIYWDHCFVSEYNNLDCCQTCAHYGLEEDSTNTSCTATSTSCLNDSFYYEPTGINCYFESVLMGASCSSCTSGASFGYYNTSTAACYVPTTWTNLWYSTSSYGYSSCAALADNNLVRVCACDVTSTYSTGTNNGWESAYNASFTFSFTPSF